MIWSIHPWHCLVPPFWWEASINSWPALHCSLYVSHNSWTKFVGEINSTPYIITVSDNIFCFQYTCFLENTKGKVVEDPCPPIYKMNSTSRIGYIVVCSPASVYWHNTNLLEQLWCQTWVPLPLLLENFELFCNLARRLSDLGFDTVFWKLYSHMLSTVGSFWPSSWGMLFQRLENS
jgi:hypothetical protein